MRVVTFMTQDDVQRVGLCGTGRVPRTAPAVPLVARRLPRAIQHGYGAWRRIIVGGELPATAAHPVAPLLARQHCGTSS